MKTNAKWIKTKKELEAPWIEKEFSLDNFSSAYIKISGLGYYELFINDKRVSSEYFKPAVSDYLDRDFSTYLYPLADKTSHRIYYNTYNIKKYLIRGKNKISILLGNGFFRQTKRTIEGNTKFSDNLMCFFDIVLDHKYHIISDGTEYAYESFIKENNLFYGEIHDYQKKSRIPYQVEIAELKNTRLLKQPCKNDVICRKIIPTLIKKTNDKCIYDLKENIAGFVNVISNGGDIFISHAEELYNDALDYSSAGGAEQISKMSYLNTQKGQTLHPYFSWSGFRYFEIEGSYSDVFVSVVNSNVQITSSFNSGNDILNFIYDSYIRTQLSNMHGGVPSDCPHRERLGYTGDGWLTSKCAMMLFDSKSFYQKWIEDIKDSADIKTGHIQHTAPFFGGGGGPGGWGGAIVFVPWNYYLVYGDKKILKNTFFYMKNYLDSMDSFLENDLIVKEREKGWCLGDWCTPTGCSIPAPFINSCFYIYLMKLVEKISRIIGNELSYASRIQKVEAAVIDKYFNKNTNSFCDSIEGSDAFAIWAGIGNNETKNNLIKKYQSRGCFDTGIFGTPILLNCLYKDHLKLVYDLLTTKSFPSFSYMKDHGATTLWESWSGDCSHNHPMFGSVVEYLYLGLLGIEGNIGYNIINIKPNYIRDLGFIEGSLQVNKTKLFVRQDYLDDGTIITIKYHGKSQVFVNNVLMKENEENKIFIKKME